MGYYSLIIVIIRAIAYFIIVSVAFVVVFIVIASIVYSVNFIVEEVILNSSKSLSMEGLNNLLLLENLKFYIFLAFLIK